MSAKGHVNGIWPAGITEGGYTGVLEALPAQAGSTLSHFSGRRCLRELLFKLTQSPARFGNLFTDQHTSHPGCELLS